MFFRPDFCGRFSNAYGDLRDILMATQLNSGTLTGLSGISRRLVAEGLLGETDARKALEDASKQKIPIGAWLIENGLVSSHQVALASAFEFGVPLFDVNALDLAQIPLKLVKEELINKHKALPLFKRGNRLFVGVSDPTNLRALDEIKFQSNHIIEPILVDEQQLARAIENAHNATSSTIADMDDTEGLEDLDVGDAGDDEGGSGVDANTSDDAPVVKFVNKVLVDAIKRGASDIHFEPYESNYRVRLRMDGMLKHVASPPIKLTPRISSRIKVMAGLDIAERRVPQDGRIKLNLSKSKSVDFRVSTCPTLFGEKIVLRILDGSAAKLGIDKLGYEDDQRDLFLSAIEKPYGMVLVTGPTGSGKTTTLYSILSHLNSEGVNIMTLEDPVEYPMPVIRQTSLSDAVKMDFAEGIRSMMRQDPDIILVGEVRDKDTAEMAFRAAMTGHLVFSTLHTNSAIRSIPRLIDLGIQPDVLAGNVIGIIAQRLVRTLCKACKAPHAPSPVEAQLLRLPSGDTTGIYRPVGCPACENQGYKGRMSILELLKFDGDLDELVTRRASLKTLSDHLRQRGFVSMAEDGMRRVREGLTTVEEVGRVVDLTELIG